MPWREGGCRAVGICETPGRLLGGTVVEEQPRLLPERAACLLCRTCSVCAPTVCGSPSTSHQHNIRASVRTTCLPAAGPHAALVRACSGHEAGRARGLTDALRPRHPLKRSPLGIPGFAHLPPLLPQRLHVCLGRQGPSPGLCMAAAMDMRVQLHARHIPLLLAPRPPLHRGTSTTTLAGTLHGTAAMAPSAGGRRGCWRGGGR